MKNIEKPMPILLIEDNEVEVNEFKHYIEGRADAKLINLPTLAMKELNIQKCICQRE